MQRRTLLASVGTTATALLAGCNSAFGGGDSDSAPDSGPGGGPESGPNGDPDGDGLPDPSPAPENSRYSYFVTLLNYTDADHEVSVTAEAEGGKALFDRTVEMDPELAMEHVAFAGDPARAVVRVDDREPRNLDWPAVDSCREDGHGGFPGLEVRIMSGANGERDDVHLDWSCQAVEADEA